MRSSFWISFLSYLSIHHHLVCVQAIKKIHMGRYPSDPEDRRYNMPLDSPTNPARNEQFLVSTSREGNVLPKAADYATCLAQV